MSAFPGSPRLPLGGIVLIDPNSGAVQRIIVLQYNPDTLSRTLQLQGIAADKGTRQPALKARRPLRSSSWKPKLTPPTNSNWTSHALRRRETDDRAIPNRVKASPRSLLTAAQQIPETEGT
jgi:hypothetical protein